MTDDGASDGPAHWWDAFYREHDELPWDTGRPQPALRTLVESNAISGPVLDVGCGTGTEALFLAERGYSVVGIDFAEPAIGRARERAAERTLAGSVAFTVADVLDRPARAVGTFETIVDVGLFHALDPADHPDYRASLAAVCRPGGHVLMVEFGADAPADWGPNPVPDDVVRSVFSEGWSIETIDAVAFETRGGDIPGLSALIRRTR